MKAPFPLRRSSYILPPNLALEGGNPDSIGSWREFHSVKCPEGKFKHDGKEHREFQVNWFPLLLS